MAIILEQVTKSFGGQQVLKSVSYQLADGSRTALMAASGEGKTTLLSIIAGLQKPDSGSVQGVPGRISMVFQENRLLEREDALTNLRVVCGTRFKEAELISELLQIGITEAVGKRVAEFSGGMKRRVAIARAMLAEAELVLMDEPFYGLDAGRKVQVMEYVRKRAAGKTLLFATHVPEEAQVLNAVVWKLNGE